MRAGMPLLLLTLVTAGCASAPSVHVVQAEPVGCQPLGEVGEGLLQCGEGAPGEELLEALKQKTRALGGNTLQCCEVGAEVVVLAAYDRHGKMVCTDFYARTGHAYACPVPSAANNHFR